MHKEQAFQQRFGLDSYAAPSRMVLPAVNYGLVDYALLSEWLNHVLLVCSIWDGLKQLDSGASHNTKGS